MDEKENTKELIVVDVKHYKKVKKALHESEERFRQLFENVPIGIYRTTPDGRILDANPALVAMLGFASFAEMTTKNVGKDFWATSYSRAAFIAQLEVDGEIKGLESLWVKKDGTPIHVRENAKLTRNEDGQNLFEGTVEDITLSKLAEAVQKTRTKQLEMLNRLICSGNQTDSLPELLNTILDQVIMLLGFDMAAIYLLEGDSQKMTIKAHKGVSKEFLRQAGSISTTDHPFAQVLSSSQSLFADNLHKDQPQLAKKMNWHAAACVPLVCKGLIIGTLNVASGQRPYFAEAEREILDLIGKEAGTLISKLQTETALRESEKYYRTLIELSPDVIVVMDLDARLLTVNQRFLQSGGYFYDEVIGFSAYDFITGLDRVFLKKKTFNFLKKKQISKSEYQFKKKDGRIIPLEVSASLLNDGQGRPQGIIAVGRDISERRYNEEAIRKNEDTFRCTFEAIPDPAYIWTRQGDGRFILSRFNRAAAHVTKNKIKLFVGIEPQQLFAAYPDFIQRMELGLENGENQSIDFLYKYQSTAESRWLQVDFAKTADNSVLVITKDITDRKLAESKLLTYQEQLRALTSEVMLVQEKERRRIASELHDQIGQNLALCKLKIAALENNLSDDTMKEELAVVRRLLECSIQDTRSLIFDLSPPILYELGFSAALEWLAERIQEQFHVPVEFESRLRDPELKSDQQVILFQVVREILINMGKHSRASQAKIIIYLKGSSLKIQVNDDGVGFDASQIFAPREQKSGFGFFSVRERLNYLGGGLEVKSKPGHGSQIILTVPCQSSGAALKQENS